MLPTAVMPLQHQLSRHTRRIEVDVREQAVPHADEQRGLGSSEKMLVHAGGDHRLMGACAGERFRLHAHPDPALAVAEGRGAFRQLILHPDHFVPAVWCDGAEPGQIHRLVQNGFQAVEVPGRTPIRGHGQQQRLWRRVVRLIVMEGHAGRFAGAGHRLHPFVDQEPAEGLVEAERLCRRHLCHQRERPRGNGWSGACGRATQRSCA
ncbi:MAG: hypothetical protein UZ03_NOB001001785 [Nitrospira sp. OLB3]|nr:MAG: hypothetical protein UZ03_NOB001001785 [Nitrospira sp. OLB3]